MKAITVDDEWAMLAALTEAVAASPDIESVAEFTSCTAALEWTAAHPVDVAFLDIKMRGMGGLALAERILAFSPGCKIVFCTGYAEYAVEAFQIHVSGYLMKPITAEAVQREIDHIKGAKNTEKLLTVQCFGCFEAFACGQALSFRRSKTKELLAFLVDRNGSGVTSQQICASLWEDGSDDTRRLSYLRQLFLDLRQTLERVGASEVLHQDGYRYALSPEKIDCDYYSYLKTGKPAFHGEYMSQYSWAEETCGLLWNK